MIYLIWEIGDTLAPTITAFTDKADFDQAKTICAKNEELAGSVDDEGYTLEALYRWGIYVVKFERSKNRLCRNITAACFGDLQELINNQQENNNDT